METQVTMEGVEQTIAGIRARNIELEVDGQKIVASQPLLPDEQKVLQENRAEAISIIGIREKVEERLERKADRDTLIQDAADAAYQRGQQEGYAAGVCDTLEKIKSAPAAAPASAAPAPTIPELELERFAKWQHEHGEYHHWEVETMQALRAAMVAGDKIQPLFAYTALIMHSDGTHTEFMRRPKKKS